MKCARCGRKIQRRPEAEVRLKKETLYFGPKCAKVAVFVFTPKREKIAEPAGASGQIELL